ncbi:MAG: phosphoglucomutase/phosphomannomutase family protein [Candidatus Caenarcaniphilales bacterium]|nr:phosphoglucomutase/phosphomannomutase family protein [Candidatus Caenarcaniphilales bacterium]
MTQEIKTSNLNYQKIKFGTDGWRAIIAEDFTFENVALVTAAIAKYLDTAYPKEKPVLLSFDPRFLADKFALYAGEVLASFGRPVMIVDRDTPTPVIAHAAKDLNSAGALQFTASHNPPEYCGIKYIPDYAGPANEAITKKIKEYVDELGKGGYSFETYSESKKHHGSASAKVFSPKEAFIKDIKKLVNLDAIKKANLKIGVDSLCGAGRGYLQEFVDCKVLLGQERDPLFRGMLPEPIYKTLGGLISAIKEHKLDIGLSNDGDADRFAILDSEGTLYSPNQILAILAKYLSETRGFKGSIVRTVATTHLLDKLAKKLGAGLIETPVGFKFIAEEMRRIDVIIGGEESGGLSILGHIPEKDGILACLLVCETMAVSGKSLKQLWKEVIDFAGFEPFYNRLDLHLDNTTKERIVKELKEAPPKQLLGKQVINCNLVDGVKLVFEDGSWLLVRPSGTEPLLRVYLEAASAAELKNMESQAKKHFGVTEGALAGAH